MSRVYSWSIGDRYQLSPGGHRIVMDLNSLRWSIYDYSGSTPSNTDDGPLWFDTTGELSIGRVTGENELHITIAVLRRESKETGLHVSLSVESAVALLGIFPQMKVRLSKNALSLGALFNESRRVVQ